MVVAAAASTLFGAALAYAQWSITPLAGTIVADSILVLKSERKLVLLSGGKSVAEYRVALGGNPIGPKLEKGDQRTPEGNYLIDYRNERSAFHRALHISYPNANDVVQASIRGVDPGGDIMIHGVGSSNPILARWHYLFDWTRGCIAVTDDEIEQIWRAVPDGARVEIRP